MIFVTLCKVHLALLELYLDESCSCPDEGGQQEILPRFIQSDDLRWPLALQVLISLLQI